MRAPYSEGKNRLAGVVTSLNDWHSTYETDRAAFETIFIQWRKVRLTVGSRTGPRARRKVIEHFINRWLKLCPTSTVTQEPRWWIKESQTTYIESWVKNKLEGIVCRGGMQEESFKPQSDRYLQERWQKSSNIVTPLFTANLCLSFSV